MRANQGIGYRHRNTDGCLLGSGKCRFGVDGEVKGDEVNKNNRMKTKYWLLLMFVLLLGSSCKTLKDCNPNWATILSYPGALITSFENDTILLTKLNISYAPDFNKLLLHDSVEIAPRREWNNYKIKGDKKVILFDTTFLYSARDGRLIGIDTNYIPKKDLSIYPEKDGWDSCQRYKIYFFKCTRIHVLCDDYKGYKIVLSFGFSKHFKETRDSQDLKLLVYKNNKLISRQDISNYYDILNNGNMQFFTSTEAVYFLHYTSEEMGMSGEKNILAKFSFDTLIERSK
jgi:hypothetical protein